MGVEELSGNDREAAVQLWSEAGLTTSWNDPRADFDRAVGGATSTVLGIRDEGDLVATAMVGHDGHRGWAYYVAVATSRRGRGLGAEVMAGAERWLQERGAVKIQLMVRHTNRGVSRFYEHLGYEDADVVVMARWLTPNTDR
jgi:ribosomal protein S18 acetylase RimI-like enzyme